MLSSDEISELFENIIFLSNLGRIDEVLTKSHFLLNQENWFPICDNYDNYGVIENQQSSSIASIIEKITNSIDYLNRYSTEFFGLKYLELASKNRSHLRDSWISRHSL